MKEEKSFDQGIYNEVPMGALIIFAIHSVSGKKECSFEELVAECFNLFPKSFSLDNYPDWPDSRKLDRLLRDLRSKGIIKGDPQSGISLSLKGQRKVQEVKKMFGQSKLKI